MHNYEQATPETFRLMPPADHSPILREDYEHMKNMIFGNKPSFDDLIEQIRQLETEINRL